MQETWKDIPNYEGKFMISSFGNVKRLERTIIDTKGRKKLLKKKYLNQRMQIVDI